MATTNTAKPFDTSGIPAPLPWSTQNGRFFDQISIMPDRWDQFFPYRLLVIDASKQNEIVSGDSDVSIIASAERHGPKGSKNAIVNFESIGSQWVFSLPISPEQLTIVDQFSINTTATLRGVIEEHNGLKFKMISASGSLGVWPYRSSVVDPPRSPTILQSVFGGTIESAQNVADQYTKIINSATSNHPASQPLKLRPDSPNAQGMGSTGYYMAMALQQFLEQYAEAKKDSKNAGWRLVFDIPKQNTSYVVTPMAFQWQQSAARALEIRYSMQLKAWRRIVLKDSVSATTLDIQPLSPGILQRILQTIAAARDTASAAIDLIGAVRSDVVKPLEVLRQTSLFVKDLAGAIITAADLPSQLQSEYASSIKDSINRIESSFSDISNDPAVRSSINQIKASSSSVEGLTLLSVSGGQLGLSQAAAQSVDPTNKIFQNPLANYRLMDLVPLTSLSLNNAQKDAVQESIEKVRKLTVDDFKSFRSTIQELALQLSNNFGAGNLYYNKIYGRAAPNYRIQPMTLDEYDILKSFYDAIQAYDILTASTAIDDANKKSSIDYVAGLADLAGIPFTKPVSKILMPVPFGLNIEAIAARYLGDPQRWLEIATLNNLRDPYIDENGFQLPLLSNGSDRQITVSSSQNLYVGQRVVLKSATQIQDARIILNIDRLSDTSYLITLDGAPTLTNFITTDLAYLQAYLPGTVNSQQKIFVPTNLPIDSETNILTPSSVSGDPLVGLSKVDWLLTDKGDLAVNSYGDFRLAAGLTNLIQALKLKVMTSRGSMILHPGYGLNLRAGQISSDINLQGIFEDLNKMIQQDSRFQGLSSLQLAINGPTLSINMAVNLAGRNGVFPIAFDLPNQ